jgi:hypothetical protein
MEEFIHTDTKSEIAKQTETSSVIVRHFEAGALEATLDIKAFIDF